MRTTDRNNGDRAGVRGATTAIAVVPISALMAADSPRIGGEDLAHFRMLAEMDAALPPVLVHRKTMRVIDGMHRVRAMQLRGEKTIEVRFFDGTDDDAFVLAVEANIAHGLPLSLADRQAAAERIVATHPEWSDRAIGKTAGLSGKAVAAIRRRAGIAVPAARVGLDGRSRPVDSAEGRRMAGELLAQRPDASLREIAAVTGISPGTVRDVRRRLARGANPVPMQRARGQDDRTPDLFGMLQTLRGDPALRLTDRGRALLRWLTGHAIGAQDRAALVEVIPAHCVTVVAELARGYAEEWREFARELEERVADGPLMHGVAPAQAGGEKAEAPSCATEAR